MRAVQIDHLEAGLVRAPRRLPEILDDLRNLVARQRARHRIGFGRGQRTRRNQLPGVPVGDLGRGLERRAALPRTEAARLAAGMPELDSRHGIMRLDEVRAALQARDERVVPQAEVADRAAPAPLHLGGFHDDQAGTPRRVAPDIHQVPVGREALHRRILVHRRDHDAVLEPHVADRDRFEQHRTGHVCAPCPALWAVEWVKLRRRRGRLEWPPATIALPPLPIRFIDRCWRFATPAEDAMATVRYALMIAAAMAAAAPARADMQLCNKTSYVLDPRSGIEEKGAVATRGWFRVDPGQCRTVLQGALTAEKAYVHARAQAAYGAPPLPQVGHADFCIADGNFIIAGAQAAARNPDIGWCASRRSSRPRPSRGSPHILARKPNTARAGAACRHPAPAGYRRLRRQSGRRHSKARRPRGARPVHEGSAAGGKRGRRSGLLPGAARFARRPPTGSASRGATRRRTP